MKHPSEQATNAAPDNVTPEKAVVGFVAEAPPSPDPPTELSLTARLLILVTAFLGWLCAGLLMSTTTLAMRSAAIDLLAREGTINRMRFQELTDLVKKQKADPTSASALSAEEAAQLKSWRGLAQEWFAYFQCAMLFGAATGGLAFGRLGDWIGRSSAMAVSILCFSLGSAAACFAQAPYQLLILWFLASLGIGGMWPNGVALLSETWSNLSRPMVAGILGTSANIGIFVLATVGTQVGVTPENWRWMTMVCACPVVLGLFTLFLVPESPRWLTARFQRNDPTTPPVPTGEVFRPAFLLTTLVGISLATIPMIGGWGSANWMVPWAGEAGETANPPNPFLQAEVGQARALTGIIGSLIGGWVAQLMGRRWAYFLTSLGALISAQYAFWFLVPTDPSFRFWVASLGFFSGIYFGWLPLFLPELFPTRVRSTGAGMSFNFGRILTAGTVFATGALTAVFGGDYPRIGRVTSLIFLLGMVVIWLAPDTSRRQLND